MRKIITSALVFALVACASAAFGGQAWTDANGDGQPDTAPIVAPASTNLTVDLWIDSQSFTYTSYNIWAEWTGGLSRIGGGVNQVAGCSNDPNDTFSHPRGIGFAGSVCNPAKHGIARIATFQLHVDAIPANVHPIIDAENTYNVFSLLSSPGGYMLFQTASGTNIAGPSATEDKSWGEIKGLYK